MEKQVTDIEIAQAAKLLPIRDVASKLAIPTDALYHFGNSKAKVDYKFLENTTKKPRGKLVLVTAITPTPAGEGKTTTTVGLGDALNRIGKKQT